MKAYEQDEMQRMCQERREVEAAPLQERKEAEASYLEAMREYPEIVAERVSWLFNGSYGWAEQQQALEIAHNKRMNRVAGLSGLIAQEEWRCPQRHAIKAWKQLTEPQQAKIAALIQKEVDELTEEEKSEAANG